MALCISWCISDYTGGWVIKIFSVGRFPERRLVFFQSHIVRLEGLHGKANWNQVIINFTLFEITTKKSLHSSDTHLQTSSGRFSWKLHCSCGLWLKVIQALDIRGKKQFKKCLFFRSRSSYGPLVWMYHSRTLNNKINKLHKRCLKLIYKDNYSIFD